MGNGFQNLLVWQKAHELMLFVHRKVMPLLPQVEKWDLIDQVRRSSKSVGANIAEGFGRFYYKDMIRFCYNARGSLCETQNHIIVAKDLQYISEPIHNQAQHIAADTYRLLNGYISFLKRAQPGKIEPGHDILVDGPAPEPPSVFSQEEQSSKETPFPAQPPLDETKKPDTQTLNLFPNL